MEMKKYKLGDLGSICMCKRILKMQTNDFSGIPFYKIGTFGGKPDAFIDRKIFEIYKKKYNYPKKGDILISAAGTIGRIVTYDGSEAYYQDSNIVWIANDETKILNKYLYYVLSSINWYATLASTIKRLYNDDIRNTEIIVPNIKNQEKIASVLSAIDNKIALNKKINKELEAMAKELYDYWFVQFDFPNEEGKPYKSSGGKMVYNEALKLNIPELFQVIPLKNIVSFLSGYSFSASDYVAKGKYKLITIKNVQDYGINLNVDNYINNIHINMPSYCKLKVGDILMSLTGNVGRIGLMFDNNCLLNQRVALLKPFKPILNAYIYFMFKSKIIRKKIESLAGGSSQANLSPIESSNITIAFNENISNDFAVKISPIVDKIINNLIENNYLIQLRDFLLPLLMNGQVEVRD